MLNLPYKVMAQYGDGHITTHANMCGMLQNVFVAHCMAAKMKGGAKGNPRNTTYPCTGSTAR